MSVDSHLLRLAREKFTWSAPQIFVCAAQGEALAAIASEAAAMGVSVCAADATYTDMPELGAPPSDKLGAALTLTPTPGGPADAMMRAGVNVMEIAARDLALILLDRTGQPACTVCEGGHWFHVFNKEVTR